MVTGLEAAGLLSQRPRHLHPRGAQLPTVGPFLAGPCWWDWARQSEAVLEQASE